MRSPFYHFAWGPPGGGRGIHPCSVLIQLSGSAPFASPQVQKPPHSQRFFTSGTQGRPHRTHTLFSAMIRDSLPPWNLVRPARVRVVTVRVPQGQRARHAPHFAAPMFAFVTLETP